MNSFDRGRVALEKEDYNLAITLFDEAIGLDREFAWAYCLRGKAYDEIGEFDKAMADLSEATRLDPEPGTA